MAAPGDEPTCGAPAFVTFLVASGRLRRSGREVWILLDFHGLLLHSSEIPGTSSSPGRRTCGVVTSLAVLGRVEVAPVGFQRRFDLLQDVALLSGRPSSRSVTCNRNDA